MSTRHHLSACLIAKNEGRYLLEWIAYHLTVGFDHFYIYDNNSTDNSIDILRPLELNGIVTLTQWPSRSGISTQVSAYNDWVERFRNETVWIGFIDADEFVTPLKDKSVPEVLQSYKEYNGLAINWKNFGSSGKKKYRDQPVIKRFLNSSDSNFQANYHVKSIVRASTLVYANTHVCILQGGRLVDESGAEIDYERRGLHTRISHKVIQINHYYTKSLEEWDAKRLRGRCHDPNDPERIRSNDLFQTMDTNEQIDWSAFRFMRETEAAIIRLKELIHSNNGLA